jgi:hypothetical protein
MEMPRPTADHQRLHLLAGEWTGREKMHPSPWDPQGGEAEGRVSNRLSLDGFAIAQDYEQKRGGQTTFRGICIMAYDANAKEYQMHWWDSMGTPVNVFRGGFEGDALKLTCENPAAKSRCTFDLAQARAGRYSFLMEVSPDGKQWFPFMEGDYLRA